MPERIQLLSGACSGLSLVQILVALAATILLLTLPTPWPWKLAALAALYAVYGSINRHNTRHHPAGQLLMRLDGTVLQKNGDKETHGVIEGAWLSRWLCVVHWAASGSRRQRHSLVCASNNNPEDFRRMLVLLRLGPKPSRDALSW